MVEDLLLAPKQDFQLSTQREQKSVKAEAVAAVARGFTSLWRGGKALRCNPLSECPSSTTNHIIMPYNLMFFLKKAELDNKHLKIVAMPGTQQPN